MPIGLRKNGQPTLRALGLNQRALGTNPRALGTNERANVTNRWAWRNYKRALAKAAKAANADPAQQ